MPDWINFIGVVPFVTIVIITLALIAFVILLSIKAHRNRVAAGREDLVGRTAVVDITLEPKGVVLVEGERWTAISDTGNIKPEEEVVITKVEGLKLRVSKNKEVNK